MPVAVRATESFADGKPFPVVRLRPRLLLVWLAVISDNVGHFVKQCFAEFLGGNFPHGFQVHLQCLVVDFTIDDFGLHCGCGPGMTRGELDSQMPTDVLHHHLLCDCNDLLPGANVRSVAVVHAATIGGYRRRLRSRR